MSITVHDMVSIRHDMTRMGFDDEMIRATIRARMAVRTPVRPAVVKVAAPRAPKPDSPIGPQARVDRTVAGGYRMGPTFCGMCADCHPAGEHTL